MLLQKVASADEPTNASPQAPKPLKHWTAEEVQNSFRKGRFRLYAEHFRNLTGGDLANHAKEDFRVRCPEMGDIIYNNLQAVQAFYNTLTPKRLRKKKKQKKKKVVEAILSQKEHDPAFPDPSDVKWDYFCDIKALGCKIGEIIKLPDLSSSQRLFPKDLVPQTLGGIILTPKRYKLLKEFADTVHLGEQGVANATTQAGMILSGPNSVGMGFPL
ncbi:hypothetical protein QOT17_015575 [Balamuthia mandrillaris]